jgi:hypothetical protein
MAKKATVDDVINIIRAEYNKHRAIYGSGVDDDVHYTDASKYANEYYGDTYRSTTRYDNDWGDY